MFLRILGGGAVGIALGVLLLLVGLARIGLFLLLGGTIGPITTDDFRLGVSYVGLFGLAGAVIGLLQPLLRRRVAGYTAAAFGGAIAMVGISFADDGLAGMDRLDWVVMPTVGALFGIAAAYGFYRGPKVP